MPNSHDSREFLHFTEIYRYSKLDSNQGPQLGRYLQQFNPNPSLLCADFNMWGVLGKNSNLEVQWLTEKVDCNYTIMETCCHFGQCWLVSICELCKSIYFIQGEQYPGILVTGNMCCAQPQVELYMDIVKTFLQQA